MSETALLNRITLAATRAGSRLFRNNIGIAHYPDAKVKYGLRPGSGDLIGWTPVKITAEMVGSTVAVFTSIEVKRPESRTSVARALAQANWAEQVRLAGGLSGEARSPEDAEKIWESRPW